MRDRRLAALGAALLLAEPALATWSVVAIDRRTRTVAVACATCIENVDLLPELPAVRPGLGVGNVQAWWDQGNSRRLVMWDGLGAGKTPQQILDDLEAAGQFQLYQYGIAAFSGPPVTHTGLTAGDGKCGLAGELGDLAWAIQGNVIAGEPVCYEAQRALVETPGDLAHKVMAAMMAARDMGGDGRCSCSPNDADGCGAPPPDFDKAAHTAFIVVARYGDEEGTCTNAKGCADGAYWLKRDVVGKASDRDPILELRDKVAAWRANQVGKPDHVQSTSAVDRQRLVADGHAAARVTVTLRDIDGTPLGHGGALLSVVDVGGGAPTALPGPVTDHGDGTYSFDLTATTTPGRGAWVVVVDFGGNKTRTLWPPVAVVSDPLAELHAGYRELSLAAPLPVPFTLNRPAADVGRPYRVLGSFSGTVPGFDHLGVHVPLNRDAFLQFTWTTGGGPPFDGSAGLLDADGRGAAWLALDPAGWAELAGERLHFSAWLGGASPAVTNLVTLDVVP